MEKRLAEAARRKELDRVAKAGSSFFRALFNEHTRPGGPDVEALLKKSGVDDELASDLRKILLDKIAKRDEAGSDERFSAATNGIKDHPHLALVLAQAWGLVPRHHNHLLDETGYVWGDEWSAGFNGEVDRLDLAANPGDRDIEPEAFRSIDAATTRDIDDAFTISQTDGGYRLRVALARPTLAWDFGSDLDREVLNRATSIYLPEGSAHMLPERLGLGTYSLLSGAPRPALVMDATLDHVAAVTDFSMRLAWVNTENITYSQVQEALAQGSDPELSLARELAGKLLQARIKSGAVVIRKPDIEMELEDAEHETLVRLKEKPPRPDAELVVSEFMLLANRLASDYGHERGIPLIHRTQDIALPPETAGIWSDPAEVFPVVKLLAPALMGTKRKPHASIGVQGYAPISSPLRRYADFINMAQVESYLRHGSPRLDQQGLDALMPVLSARLQDVTQIQRFRPRYWKILYLKQHLRQPVSGVVVDDGPQMVTFAIPNLQIYVRVPVKIAGEKTRPGQMFQLRFNKADPLVNEMRVSEALEE